MLPCNFAFKIILKKKLINFYKFLFLCFRKTIPVICKKNVPVVSINKAYIIQPNMADQFNEIGAADVGFDDKSVRRAFMR